jgi:M6 family metalloprotease-like protein
VAEGAGEESIWPHQATGYFGTMGGKSFTRYFCTSELRGYIGTDPASIGTTCHEFAHSLGLPDFYDTDYGNSGGQNYYTIGVYDLMASGNYNDLGRRPPYLNALERNMLGWMDYPESITSSGNFVLQAVQYNVAYQFESSTPGEYFILESRNGNKWDSAIPSGLLISTSTGMPFILALTF